MSIEEEVERDGWVCGCFKRGRNGAMTHIKVHSAKIERCHACRATKAEAVRMIKELRAKETP